MAAKNDNFKAGLFVIAGLIVAFAAIVMLSDIDAMFAKTQQVTVRFSLKDGVQGLREGAVVTIGNYPVGSVVAVRDEMEGGQLTAKLIVAEIPASYALYDNAEIEIVAPPIGGGAALNIRSVGFDASGQERNAVIVQGWRVINVDEDGNPVRVPTDLAERGITAEQIKAEGVAVIVDAGGGVKAGDSWAYQPDEIIRGGVAASPLIVDLVAEVGIGDVQRQQLREIIGNFHAISENLAKDPERYDKLIEDVAALAGDTRAVLASVKERSPVWWDRLDTITKNIDEGSLVLAGILQENRPVIKEGLATAKQAIAKADEVMAHVKDTTLGKIDTALDKANKAVDDVQMAVRELSSLVVTQKPVLERMIANMRLTSDQLKLAAIEIRRSPWRLLYKPTDQELETDNLYDAARSFALAAGSLESTADSLKAMVNKQGGAIPTDDANLKLMLDNLHKTFEQFAEAEDKFWDALDRKVDGPSSKP
jgi:ABC-type transporter Mla subunit MlaD